MKLSTRLRLISMKGDIRGHVARIILNNVGEDGDIGIATWIRDVLNNGCPYSDIKGLKFHNEIQAFYDKNKMDIEMLVFLYETTKNRKLEVIDPICSTYSWFAFECILVDFVKLLNIR